MEGRIDVVGGDVVISTQEALQKILETVPPGKPIEVALEDARGCFLASDIKAFLPLPHFDNSAMDGYAVRAVDVASASENGSLELSVTRIIPAGDDVSDSKKFSVGPGEAAQIFTGAMVPVGADTVIRQEDVRVMSDDRISISVPPRIGLNIRRRGEEVDLGDVVMRAGAELTPAAMGLLASFGFTSVNVIQRPCVGCLVTGSELVPAGHALPPGTIYDSNSIMLSAAINETGLQVGHRQSCSDDHESLRAAVVDALDKCDVVLVSGGVSVGAYDFVKDAASQAGIDEVFWKVLQKPGKPFYFGATADRDKFLFGLPGNPASALSCFYEYVRPALRQLMGAARPEPTALRAQLAGGFTKRVGLTHFLKGRFQPDGTVMILEKQGSHMMSSFAEANCLVVIPADVEALQKGDGVEVHLI